MSTEEERASAEKHAREALAWIAEHEITPSPESFEVAFSYVTRQHDELRRNIESVMRSGGKIDDYIVTVVHQRYFRSPKIESTIASVSEELARKLDATLRLLQEGECDQAAHGQELNAAADALVTAGSNQRELHSVLQRALAAMDDMRARYQVLQGTLQKAAQDVSALREHLEVTKRQSLTDPLTGIANRKAFELAIQREIDASIESGEALSLMVCDVDHFKRFHDQWGDEIGDQVLKTVAACLSRNVKGRDFVARIGGEVFAVILPKTNLDEAAILVKHIRNDLGEKKLVKKSTGAELTGITLSVGVAQHALSDTIADLLHRADLCLDAAKRAGRDAVVCETDGNALEAASAHAA